MSRVARVKDLLLDLTLTVPGLAAELLPEDTPMFRGEKAWFRNQAAMPDEAPVYLFGDLPGYSGGVHDGFRQWLRLRGWDALPFDGIHPLFLRWAGLEDAVAAAEQGTVHLLLPLETIERELNDMAAEAPANTAGDPAPQIYPRLTE